MDPKDPEETVLVEFDFTDLVDDLGLDDTVLINPVIEIARDSGDGALVAVGTPQINGLIIQQLYSGGTRGINYDMACFASFSNGERRRIADQMLVE